MTSGRANRTVCVGANLLQFKRGSGAAQVVDAGIVGKTDKVVLLYRLQDTGGASGHE